MKQKRSFRHSKKKKEKRQNKKDMSLRHIIYVYTYITYLCYTLYIYVSMHLLVLCIYLSLMHALKTSPKRKKKKGKHTPAHLYGPAAAFSYSLLQVD